MADEGSDGTTTSTTKSTLEALESLDAIIAKKKEILALDQQDAKSMNDLSETMRLQSQLMTEDLKLQASKVEKLKDEKEIFKLLSAEQQEILEISMKGMRLSEKKLIIKKEALKLIAKQRAQQELIRDTSKQTDNFMAGIAGKLGIAAKFSETSAGQFTLMAQNLASMQNPMEFIKSSFLTTFDPLNIAVALLEKMAESIMLVAIGIDSANSSFQRATGFARDFNEELLQISRNGVTSGVTIEQAGAAMASLSNNFSAFNPNATQTNINLANTITLLEKTGVSADQSAKTMDFFNKVIGKTPQAAANMTTQLALAGTEIGISTSKMLSDFESVNGYLVGFGDRTTEVFLELQAQSKATGIAVSSLVGIAQKFDTFKGAADAVGQLNSVLGTNLSTIEMLNMSTDERLSMLSQEIDFASGGFDNLDRYTQMYVAQTLGVKDVGEAQRLLNLHRNPAELAKYNAKMQTNQARQKDLKEITEKMVPVMENFQIALTGLGLALSPIIEVLGKVFALIGGFVQGLVDILNWIPGATTAVAGLVTALTGLAIIRKINAAFKAAKAIQMALTTQTGALALSQQALVVSQTELAVTEKVTAPVIQRGSGQMAAGFIKLAPALFIASGAMLLVAVSFDLIARAVISIVPSFIKLFKLFRDNLSVIPEMSLVLGLFGSSFLLSGAMIFSGATLMAAAMIPLAVIGLGLVLMVDPIERLGAGFAAMGTGIQMAAAGIAPLIAGLAQMQDLTDDDGFFAITTDGSSTSMVSAKGGTLTNFSSENITVDVKIPKIEMPIPIVKVYIGDTELRTLIRTEVENRVGSAGR